MTSKLIPFAVTGVKVAVEIAMFCGATADCATAASRSLLAVPDQTLELVAMSAAIVPVVVITPPVKPVLAVTDVTPVLVTVHVPDDVITHVPPTEMPVPAAIVTLVTVPEVAPGGAAQVPSARR